MPRIQPASIDLAESVLNWWKGDPTSLKLLSDSGNTIYLFNDSEGISRILRLTYSSYRTIEQVRAELDFLKHLEREGFQVPANLLTTNGRGVIPTLDQKFWCSVFENIDGFEMKLGGDHWNDNFFKDWGVHIAKLHVASKNFQLAPFAPQLPNWYEDLLFKMADELLAPDDQVGRLAYNQVLRECTTIKRTSENYGLIHGEFIPHNFRYNPMTGTLIPFGFRNACYHWYMADLAGAFSSFRALPDASSVEKTILEGYQSVRPISDDEFCSIEILKRQRALYIYLDCIYWPGSEPSEVETAKIKLARGYLETLLKSER